MKKKTDKQFDKVLLWLAIVSLLISIVEGFFFYSSAKYPHPLFRLMLIAQNSIRAFAFRGDISLKNIVEVMQGNPSEIEQIVGYLYAVAVFIAPYCTLKFIYKVLDKLLRFKNWRPFSKKPRVVIFGYNDEVEALISNEAKQGKKAAYRLHIVSPKISDDEEKELRQKGILVHRIDCLKLDTKQLVYFFKQMELSKAKKIILFHDSSAQNFSLYKLLHTKKSGVEKKSDADKTPDTDKNNPSDNTPLFPLQSDVKVICRCENQSVQQILEDYHDLNHGLDLEVINIPELRIKSMLEEKPLHTFYKKTQTPAIDWHLHLLIIGFGKLGQELLLQTMNLGVVSSTNRILVDVVDLKMDEKQSIFANHFNENYVNLGANEFSIPSDRADGSFVVRFHKMDIRYQQFYDQLRSYGSPEKDEAYTYIAICVEDEDLALHSMSVVQRYLQALPDPNHAANTAIGVRMELDKQMASYLNTNEETYKNVFAMSDSASVITLDDLFHDDLDQDAKDFNMIYNSINIQSEEKLNEAANQQSEKEPKEEANQQSEKPKTANDHWRELVLFRRNSSRALAQHSAIKEFVFGKMDSDKLNEMLGEDGTLLRKVNINTWTYDDLDRYVAKLSDHETFPWVEELSKMEHRRWCYFMASCGWQRASAEEQSKDKKVLESEKKNVCMCTWEDLLLTRKDTCPYDLMWLLLKYNENCKKANTTQT